MAAKNLLEKMKVKVKEIYQKPEQKRWKDGLLLFFYGIILQKLLFFSLCWVLAAAWTFSTVAENRGYFLAARRQLLVAGSLPAWSTDSRAPRPQQRSQALRHRLGCRGTQGPAARWSPQTRHWARVSRTGRPTLYHRAPQKARRDGLWKEQSNLNWKINLRHLKLGKTDNHK